MLYFLIACSGKDDSAGGPVDDSEPTTDPSEFLLFSPDFESASGDPLAGKCNRILPASFTCDGSNPELRWDKAATDTRAYALIAEDDDGPLWGIYDISLTADNLDAGISGAKVKNTPPSDAVELDDGYAGPCGGSSRIVRWRLWALRDTIDDEPDKAKSRNEAFEWLESEATYLAYEETEACSIFNP